MTNKTDRPADVLMRLLEMIDTEMAVSLLKDLRDEDKRTPQLYQAINRFLDRHDFGIKSLMVDEALLGTMQEEAHAAIAEFLAAEEDEASHSKTWQ